MRKMSDLLASASMNYAEGMTYHRQGNPKEALRCYLQALRVQPENSDILLAIGAALHDLEQYAEALTVYQRIQDSSGPVSAALWHNRGNTQLALDHFNEAIDSYRQAVAIDPEDVEALVTMGTALEQLGRYQPALRCYEEALRRNPDCAEAHWNLASGLLRFGEYQRGWAEFAWRWQKKGYTTKWRDLPAPQWQGEPLRGRQILIHAEQAFGDAIQFARYLPLVAASGANIIFECPQPLVALFDHDGTCEQVIASGAPLPKVDFHLPMLDLPLFFGTTVETIPATVPYIAAPPVRLLHWQRLVGCQPGMKVGLVWAGRRRPDPHRSAALRDFAPLAALPGVTWYSLQVGEGAEQATEPPQGMTLVDLTDRIDDFADTAAILHCLDLVISIDTSVVHLAGAMGKPTFLLVPLAPDWRWMLQRNDSPWYPTMRIYRQKVLGNWADPISEIAVELTAIAQAEGVLHKRVCLQAESSGSW